MIASMKTTRKKNYYKSAVRHKGQVKVLKFLKTTSKGPITDGLPNQPFLPNETMVKTTKVATNTGALDSKGMAIVARTSTDGAKCHCSHNFSTIDTFYRSLFFIQDKFDQ